MSETEVQQPLGVLAPESRQKLEKLIVNAPHTCALVGFPNSGKTAYLLGLGKKLIQDCSDGRWRITGSSEDIFSYVRKLTDYRAARREFEAKEVKTDRDIAQWRATEPLLAPTPLNLFDARRQGLWPRQTSAFDTSGEQYYAITEDTADPENQTLTEYYAGILRERVLPRCPGLMMLVDSTVSPDTLEDHVTRYLILLSRVYGSAFDEPAKRRRPLHNMPFRRPLPVALTLTKVDELDGRAIALSTEDSVFLRHLRAAGSDPAEFGVQIKEGNIATYLIRKEVFLDEEKYPAELGQAVITDYLYCHMPRLVDLLNNMRTCGRYEVELFAVSAFGKRLARDDQGVEALPEPTEIAPARVLTPQFWLLERIHRSYRHHQRSRIARASLIVVICLLLLGPGLYWGLYGLARRQLSQFQRDPDSSALTSAYYALWLNNQHPFTRFVQPYWEPQAQHRLLTLNDDAIDKLLARNDSDDKDRARKLIDQASRLGLPMPDIQSYQTTVLAQDFRDALGAQPLARLWQLGQTWLKAEARSGSEAFSAAVSEVAEALQHTRFDGVADLGSVRRAFLETVAELAGADLALLDRPAANACRQIRALDRLGQARALLDRPIARGAGTDLRQDARVMNLRAAVELLDEADSAARNSSDAGLMREVYAERLGVYLRLLQIFTDQAIGVNAENYQFDQLQRNWQAALELFEECPALKRPLHNAALRLVETLKSTAEITIGDLDRAILSDNCRQHAGQARAALAYAARIQRQLGLNAEVAELTARSAICSYLEIECIGDGAQRGDIRQLLSTARSDWLEAERILNQSRAGRETYQRLYQRLTSIGVRLWQAGILGVDDLDPPVAMRRLVLGTIEEHLAQQRIDAALDGILTELNRAALDSEEDRRAFQGHLREVLRAGADAFGAPGLDAEGMRRRLDRIISAARLAGAENLIAPAESLRRHVDAVAGMTLIQTPAGQFYISPTEVTVAEYRRFLAETDADVPAPYFSRLAPDGSGRRIDVALDNPAFSEFYSGAEIGNSPIVGVSQGDAQAYARHRGRRLPTLWEYQLLAAQLPGEAAQYARLGREADPELANVNQRPLGITPVERVFGDAVGNVVGIAGNVREWCGDTGQRVPLFGMSYFRPGQADWVENPVYVDPEYRDASTGFRTAADILPADFALPALSAEGAL